VILVLLVIYINSFSQTTAEFTSNLPIILIDTEGRSIPDEPKIMAKMQIIYNGEGEVNSTSDSAMHYDGWIGIERRGSSTQQFEKKSYSLETRDESGENNNVELLGLPRENDWILYAPFSDKTLMRNALIFKLSNDLGMYAPRTRFCEVFLNDDYRGIYVFMEKVKRDDDRVDIARLNPEDIEGDQLTGGYIMRIDWPDNGMGWYTPYSDGGDYEGGQAKILYYDPKGEELVPEQKSYIKDYITDFEDALQKDDFNDPETGYRQFINLESFYHYFIFQELANNVDAYSLSTFFYKDRDSTDGKLTMGPLWDFNHSFGNVDYGGSHSTKTFSFNTYLDPAPKWWRRLLADSTFVDGLSERWNVLRQDILGEEHILAIVDSFATILNQAQERNFERWDILGEYVWPNYFIGDTYAEEVDYMKDWIEHRIVWLDDALPSIDFGEIDPVEEPDLIFNRPVIKADPNPFHLETNFIFYVPFEHQVVISLYDVLGKEIVQFGNGVFPEGTHTIQWDGMNKHGIKVANGIYFYRFIFNYETVSVNKLVKF
jgi:hypothetical protein